MANGYTLGVGFYPVDGETGEPKSGPHYTRLEAVNSVSVPCCILEVVGDWQTWLNKPPALDDTDDLPDDDEVMGAATERWASDGGNMAGLPAESAE